MVGGTASVGSVLAVRHLTITSDRMAVIDDLRFTVAPTARRWLAIIGPTGAGKTVLFRAFGARPDRWSSWWRPSSS
jgi:ABC-type transporter Mla maintaining outer membrane lipid asymmetry ATPase subunit MlaF